MAILILYPGLRFATEVIYAYTQHKVVKEVRNSSHKRLYRPSGCYKEITIMYLLLVDRLIMVCMLYSLNLCHSVVIIVI